MKILIGTLSYKPNVSGVAVEVELLTQFLLKKGHQVVIVAPSRSLRSHIEHQDGLTIYRVRAIPSPIRRGFYLPIFTGRLTERILQEVQPDIVHVHDPMAMSRYLQQSATKHGVPTVASNHFTLDYIGAYLPGILRPIVLGWLRRMYVGFYNRCQAVTAPSVTVVNYLRSLGVRDPIEALSNGVDIDRFSAHTSTEQTRRSYGLPQQPIILYLGRMEKAKSINVLIDAFARVHRTVDCHLLLVGGGDNLQDLAAQIAKYGLSKSATLTGLIPYNSVDLAPLYQVADIYVMPSSIETQSITTLEALAAGRPVVAANGGALPELIKNGVNGILFRAGSSADLADRILTLLHDSTLRSRLSGAAVKTAAKHELQKSLQLFEDLYETTIRRVSH
ncbi:hypothetical protein A3A71_00135 [Candidatus Berkelbacteria bacterium RIFCSPLOWO2_01_FULL_50_28]|uniref:Glycosyltransferase subfamily 4-like N-terminal domain-containing protein n=1 Tax=Candidatus Berkelbacteria bacterium RIFCSPLOWO2_01_FULL_50_28 TaxID=1797471 RepID=A0A1F5EAX9_9BACT|nr:MAG: hypothetical protein A2807_00065 [Candidatus Berkelbacteria bacterium RIFCSPHIGHO2_01_FULL_50_36]OGD64460.1 MAG: hypothetical protein A3A71_00135 [Candidatus Berkelbacteria bacterium RIFCSPLOWO2_01_FULL_50_28]